MGLAAGGGGCLECGLSQGHARSSAQWGGRVSPLGGRGGGGRRRWRRSAIREMRVRAGGPREGRETRRPARRAGVDVQQTLISIFARADRGLCHEGARASADKVKLGRTCERSKGSYGGGGVI